MNRLLKCHVVKHLDPEKVAYWYFRLNGFLQIENFIVHPGRRGGQRTDADLLGVRFPFRAERLFDDPDDIMHDDAQRLNLSTDKIDIVIVEVKANQPCALNGPGTRHDGQNVHRVLAAIGCIPTDRIETAATSIYQAGFHATDMLRIRLVVVGRNRNNDVATRYPAVTQLVWTEMLAFIWDRFHRYRRQKTQVDQWDADGLEIKFLADRCDTIENFISQAMHLMGCTQ